MLCVVTLLPSARAPHYEDGVGWEQQAGQQECKQLHNNILLVFDNNVRYTQSIGGLMSTESEDETVDRESIISLERLLRESEIKDLALNKATHLINLLTQELETQRAKRAQAARQVEEQYERQIESMAEKIEFLQRQLKRSHGIQNVHVQSKTVEMHRRPIITRTNSTNSLSAKRKKSNNKKYTEINSQQNYNIPTCALQLAIFQDIIFNYQEWKVAVVEDLNCIAMKDYQQLKEYMDRVEHIWQQIDETFAEPISPELQEYFELLRQENSQLREIMRSQQLVINELRNHVQAQQDTYRHMIFKLSNPNPIREDKNCASFNLHPIASAIIAKAAQAKALYQKKYESLQDQNNELKNILDSIISLVQVQGRRSF